MQRGPARRSRANQIAQPLPQGAGETQRGVGAGKATAGPFQIGNGAVLDRLIGHRDVAATVSAGDVRESAVEDERQFGSVMGVGGNRPAGADPVKVHVAAIDIAEIVLLEARQA